MYWKVGRQGCAAGCVAQARRPAASQARPPACVPPQNLNVVLVPNVKKQPSGLECKLQCTQCLKHLAPSNVARIASSHFRLDGNCRKRADELGRIAKRVRPSSGGAGSSIAGSSATQPDITTFATTPSQREQAIRHLAKFLCVRSTPSAIEDENLRRAFAVVGVDLPGDLGSCQQAARCAMACSWRPECAAARPLSPQAGGA